LVTTNGIQPDSEAARFSIYQPHRSARLNGFLGLRHLTFIPVRGLDALRATEDVPLGFQGGAVIGRSMAGLGDLADDIHVASDLYMAFGRAERLFRAEARVEGRRDNDANRWDGILTSGRATESVKLGGANTSATIEWGSGWRQRVPFGVTLGARDGGIRGFTQFGTLGGQRLVMRLESRWDIDRFARLGTGVAVFADAGRLWAGDVPLGASTPVRTAVGISLLGALPPQSHRLWRLDLTCAQRPFGGGLRWQLRFSGADRTRVFLDEPDDIARSRERTAPVSIYRWP
jgi:hypothetical protein